MQKTNNIILKGVIKNIQYSHTIGDIDYSKADLVTKRKDGKEDILSLKFKKFSCPYGENQEVSLVGNIRSFSQLLDNGKSSVSVYVFTYFDEPEEDYNNHFEIYGTICKMEELHTVESGKQNVHYIVANNISSDNSKLNSYLPCVSWGTVAKGISKLPVGTKVAIFGEFHSKSYKKMISDTDYEIRIAHELVVTSYSVLDTDEL